MSHCYNPGNVNTVPRYNGTSAGRSIVPFPGVGVAPERLTIKAEGAVLVKGRERVSHFLKQGAACSVLLWSQCILIGRWEAPKKHVLCVKGETKIH